MVIAVLVGTAIMLASGAWAQPAAADGLLYVTVDADSGGSYTKDITGTEVAAGYDVANQRTTITSASAPPAIVSETGMSIGQLASLAGVDPADVTQATLLTANAATLGDSPSTAATVYESEVQTGFLGDPNAPGIPEFALVKWNGEFFTFVRPMRYAGDDNGDNQLTSSVSSGSPSTYLDVTLDVSSEVLTVGALSPTPTTTSVGGQVVSFSAPNVTLAGLPEQSGLTYAWDFGDGSPLAAGPTASHSYATAGTWPVSVTVTDAGGHRGVSTPPVSVQVSGPTTAAVTTTTATTFATASTGGGGALPSGVAAVFPQSDGGTPGGGGTGPSTALPSGAASGRTAGPSTLPRPGSTTAHTREPARARHRTTVSPPSGSGHAAAGTGPGVGAGLESHASGTGAGQSANGLPAGGGGATQRRRRPDEVAPSGPTGLLVDISIDRSQLSGLTPGRSPRQLAAARGSSGDGGGWAAWVLGIGVAVALIALGGLRELDLRARHRTLAAP